MSFRDEIQKRLNKQKREILDIEQRIQDLSTALETARSYAQGMEDAMKLIPMGEDENGSRAEPPFVLRQGTSVWLARQMILEHGKPLHIGELLKAMGKGDSASTRVSLAGSLGAYVRDGKIFSRPAPNVFGLIELERNTKNLRDDQELESAA